MIRFLKDASEYGTYHEALSKNILEDIPGGAHVCDAGCGLGYLSLALAEGCRKVTAVDVSKDALNVLRENIAAQGKTNIEVLESDIAACPPKRPYDAMVFCFFGSTHKALRIAKEQCSKTLILVKRDWRTHRFNLGKKSIERFTLGSTLEELDALGVRAQVRRLALEMGQPFRTLEDAVEFFRTYDKEERSGPIDADEVQSRLVPIEAGEYRYYLPTVNRVGIIAVDIRDIPDAIDQERFNQEETKGVLL
ncbi:MAG: class I SAM-dependent methyltransferase [Bacillota bacterium]